MLPYSIGEHYREMMRLAVTCKNSCNPLAKTVGNAVLKELPAEYNQETAAGGEDNMQ